jgi:hypothetical protein
MLLKTLADSNKTRDGHALSWRGHRSDDACAANARGAPVNGAKLQNKVRLSALWRTEGNCAAAGRPMAERSGAPEAPRR